MSLLAVSKKLATKSLGKTQLFLKQHGPVLLTVGGIAAVVGSGVLLVKATLDSVPDIEEAGNRLEELKQNKANRDEKELAKDRTHVYLETGKTLAKRYAPAVTTGAVGVAFILAGHNMLSKRNAALAAAYKTLESTFSDYKERVESKLSEKDLEELKRPFQVKEEVNEAGEKVQKVELPSEYAKIFDESNPLWDKTPEYSLMFLNNIQTQMNNRLHAYGHVFLNDVYKELGFPPSQAGQIVGWKEGNGDDFIDFNIYDLGSEKARDFVNGYEKAIILDFNVDGPILDLI